jgi:Ca2+-transporting ATPase
LLWINLVTDGLPALALVLERPSVNVMRRPPRSSTEPLLGRSEWLELGLVGVFEGSVVLGSFWWAQRAGDVEGARTLAFATLVFCELFRAFAARSRSLVFWELGAFTNVRLLGVVALSLVAQLALHSLPALQRLFQLGPFEAQRLAVAVALGLLPVTFLELSKLVRRRRRAATAYALRA